MQHEWCFSHRGPCGIGQCWAGNYTVVAPITFILSTETNQKERRKNMQGQKATIFGIAAFMAITGATKGCGTASSSSSNTTATTQAPAPSQTAAPAPTAAPAAPATAAPATTAAPADNRPHDKHFAVTSLQLKSDFANDFGGTARIQNTSDKPLTATFKFTFMQGSKVVGTADGSAQGVAPQQTVSVDLISQDAYVAGTSYTFQVDVEY